MHLVDFHSHVLPGVDHGSASLDCSMVQMAFAVKRGISEIVATPHFYPHRHDLDAFLRRRSRGYAALTEALQQKYGESAPLIHVGAEVLLCPGIDNLDGLEKLCIEGTRVLLLELPFHDLTPDERVTVEHLIKKGFTVLLAHVDRYQQEDIEYLAAKGALMQLNAEAISRLIVPTHLVDWIADDRIFALGSDLHGEDKKAYARFIRAERKLKDHLSLVNTRSHALLRPVKVNASHEAQT